MFNNKCDCTEELKKQMQCEFDKKEVTLRKDLEIERANAKAQENRDMRSLQDQIVSLQADLKIAKDQNSKIEAEQKAKYTEHVMAVTDERVKEMRALHDTFAKNLVEVVKAAAGAGANVSTSVVTK